MPIKTIDDFTAEELKMMPKSARPIGFSPLPQNKINDKYIAKKRVGKTAKDHKRSPATS